MILVTLGTQDKKFYRLIEAVDKAITAGAIDKGERVVVQAGSSADYKPENGQIEIFDLLPMEEFDGYIANCDLLITHGGVGSIITGLRNGKKVIAAARLEKYGEHENDHQLQIIENFTAAGYILSLEDFDKLPEKIREAETFEPKSYQSNTDNFRKLIEEEIDKYLS